jgi:hypothetical protein
MPHMKFGDFENQRATGLGRQKRSQADVRFASGGLAILMQDLND